MIKRVVKAALLFAALLLAAHFATYAYINDIPAFPDPNDKVQQWYFAYGSGLSTRYLANIRSVAFYQPLAAQVYDYLMSFTLLGIPHIETSFVIMSSQHGHRAFGVLHYITQEDMHKTLNSKSSTGRVVDINVTDSSANRHIAKTLPGDAGEISINGTSA
jgi:hypothetical protein